MYPLIEPELLTLLLHDELVRVLDVRFNLSDTQQGRYLYQQAHIPGAVYVDLEQDLSNHAMIGRAGRHPLPDPARFLEKIQAWGIQQASKIIIYDAGNHAMAARAWWLLRWMGLTNVAVLHGGMKVWRADNYPLDAGRPVFKRSTIKLQPGHMPVANIETIFNGLGSAKFKLIDARSEERFYGKSEPIDSRSGHIPGAICHPFTRNMDKQGRFLSAQQLEKLFIPLLDGREEKIFYCGSGITACHNILAMEYAGLGTGTLYPGSWSEWVIDPKRPVQGYNQTVTDTH
ncbi:MAG: sulfurtransferase [Endozoicomonas sp. (ex Botrylloides leachii)]|nr:sulfurtransferase [Endozoicomonas sp. (ex Botrylloides leachii)]